MRKGKGTEQITITEETYIEGADVTLEPDDKVRVLEKTNNELGYLDWEMMQLDTLDNLLYTDLITVNDIDDEGMTPLLYAIKTNNNRLVVKLYTRGADVNDTRGRMKPLQFAQSKGNQAIVDFLIDVGAV